MLHPTFENPRRVFAREPYLLQEKGWGEFDMRVVLHFAHQLAEPENIFFDLHFREHTYTILHRINFVHPSPDLVRLLNTEPEPMYHDSIKKRRASPPLLAAKKIKTPPTVSSPAQFSDGPLTPYSKYPTSPSNNDIESDDVFRNLHGRQIKDGVIIDNVYDEKDVDNVHSIHKSAIDDRIRKAWGLPMGLDMLELARRLSTRSPEEITEIETLILTHRKDDMLLEDNEDEFMVDLYSLGPELLNLLWEYTENKTQLQNTTEMSPFSLVQANTNMMEYD
ncbi:uncharacterized protein B0P05DRAFT_528416 [Gilbertella persicaria]|nr:uncharacterized protein B0P05DRAFT_528416 [Gilbertella persicaria]KAI8091017.1 hypothetical protein B0P05DRAFT_528416 [Gilbertella persicaria]